MWPGEILVEFFCSTKQYPPNSLGGTKAAGTSAASMHTPLPPKGWRPVREDAVGGSGFPQDWDLLTLAFPKALALVEMLVVAHLRILMTVGEPQQVLASLQG
jgi:hypothetical protein